MLFRWGVSLKTHKKWSGRGPLKGTKKGDLKEEGRIW